MKKTYIFLFLAAGLLFFFFLYNKFNNRKVTSIIPEVKKPLLVYTIENLIPSNINEGKIKLKETNEQNKEVVSQNFEFSFNPNPSSKLTKMTTGQINFPLIKESRETTLESSEAKSYPVVVMIRGYVDQATYKSGDGTRNAASYFAKNGFITISLDFLGYAGSDKEAGNIFETRFQSYVAVISLIKSLPQIPKWDQKNIFIWAHSNGGQIALSVLSATSWNYPTSLWAPVTKPFPYSVLYYTDESVDGGKLIRRELAKFEDIYDTDLFSFANYLERIKAPLSISQGSSDTAVPYVWSEQFVKKAGEGGINASFFECPGCDHNMRPDWNHVVNNDLLFFGSHMLE